MSAKPVLTDVERETLLKIAEGLRQLDWCIGYELTEPQHVKLDELRGLAFDLANPRFTHQCSLCGRIVENFSTEPPDSTLLCQWEPGARYDKPTQRHVWGKARQLKPGERLHPDSR